jgi:hypothetical protein
MLAQFTITKQYCKLQATLYVDCERGDAECAVKYNRRIVAIREVPFYAVSTPDHAEKWFSYTRDEHGSLVETLEWQARKGLLTMEPA